MTRQALLPPAWGRSVAGEGKRVPVTSFKLGTHTSVLPHTTQCHVVPNGSIKYVPESTFRHEDTAQVAVRIK